jgi:hypothetical protein
MAIISRDVFVWSWGWVDIFFYIIIRHLIVWKWSDYNNEPYDRAILKV